MKICSICKKVIVGYPALSREDNITEICSLCGNLQALEIAIKAKEKKGGFFRWKLNK